MQSKPKLQLRSLQAGRGLAALLVVALHSAGYFNYDKRYWNRPDLFHLQKGGQIGVEYFFVLSGAVILIAHWDDIGRPRTVFTYLQKRFRRIYPIYWLILSVVVLEYALRPGLGAAYQTDPLVVVSGYLLVHLGSLQVNLPTACPLADDDRLRYLRGMPDPCLDRKATPAEDGQTPSGLIFSVILFRSSQRPTAALVQDICRIKSLEKKQLSQ